MPFPHELTQYPQWVVWKSVRREDGALTKLPINPHTLRAASVTNSAHWGTFAEAVAVSEGFDGLGFVLTDLDPYCFIDFDVKDGISDEEMAFQRKIFDRIPTYAERSPSGKGLHLICKAEIPYGRRRKSVEMYSSERFMTMTGNTYRDVPIIEAQEVVSSLFEYLDTFEPSKVTDYPNQPETISDQELGDTAYRASNGERFGLLWAGRWKDAGYESQSEADFALINIIAFYTGNREQVRRMFLNSALGQRQKARRHKTYVSRMIERSFDQKLKPLDLSNLAEVIERAVITHKQAEPSSVLDLGTDETHEWSFPRGLIGDIAEFIYEASPRPLREVSLITAIGLMCGICGRAYNVNGQGLNQYLFLVGGTGIGKNALQMGLDKFRGIISEAIPAAKTFFGPSEIASSQALLRYMSDGNPSLVSYAGEIGHVLGDMSSARPSPHIDGFKRLLLRLYTSSGEGHEFNGSIYSDKEKGVSGFKSPAFTWIGETTPSKFYEVLTEKSVADGFIPRFLTIDTKAVRPRSNPNAGNAKPSRELVNKVCNLANEALALNAQNKARHVQFAPDAAKLLGSGGDFDLTCDDYMRKHALDDCRAELWNRAHLKALKLAALIAVGRNYLNPTIELEDAEWAIRLVTRDINNMLGRFENGEILATDVDSQQAQKLALICRDWIVRPFTALGAAYRDERFERLHKARLIPYAFIQSRTTGFAAFRTDRRGATRAIKETLQTMVERGDLNELPKHETERLYGTRQAVYQIANPRTFGLV